MACLYLTASSISRRTTLGSPRNATPLVADVGNLCPPAPKGFTAAMIVGKALSVFTHLTWLPWLQLNHIAANGLILRRCDRNLRLDIRQRRLHVVEAERFVVDPPMHVVGKVTRHAVITLWIAGCREPCRDRSRPILPPAPPRCGRRSGWSARGLLPTSYFIIPGTLLMHRT